MKKALTVALVFSCLALGLSRSNFAQDNTARTPVSAAVESGNRQEDKLVGPVRRVRVEAAKITPKDGKWVEGPREVLGITTYDLAGRKIDSVVSPMEGSILSGKEEYLYDDKGNVVGRILRGPDGSMLSKESYQYEFDQLGNWTKLSSSVAVYENGKIVFEPTGITYRTISYYYNQAIEKLNAPAPKSNGISAPSTSSQPPPNPTASSTGPSQPSISNAQVSPSSQPLSAAANAHAKTELVTAPASVSPANNITAVPESPVATSSEIRTTPDNAPATNVVQHVTEEALRNAAIELPKPDYTTAAVLAGASGKVKVHILVDEKGQVTNAQATSGHPLLGAAAEAAARKARFSLAQMSPGATRVYGVISYDFVAPTPVTEAVPATSPTTHGNPPTPVDRQPEATPIPPKADFVESKPKASANFLESAKSFYDKAVALDAAGKYPEAAEAFNRSIKVNPNDAKAYAGLGMAYSAMQKHKDAIVVYKMALQIDGSVLGVSAYYMWGHSYLALDKTSDALKAFKQALYIARTQAIDTQGNGTQRYPSLEHLHYGMGIAYFNLRRFADSIVELKQVVTLNPKNGAGHYSLALAYRANGNRWEAEKQQRTLSSVNPDLARKLTIALAPPEPPPGCSTNILRCR